MTGVRVLAVAVLVAAAAAAGVAGVLTMTGTTSREGHRADTQPAPAATSQSKTPTAPTRTWPGPGTTGVPPGTTLTAYAGGCTVTVAGARIDAKRASCALIIHAPDVHITRSELVRVEVGEAPASVIVEDTLVDAGDWVGAAVGDRALTLRRVEVRGGQHSVQCSSRCLVEDSWLHDQSLPPDVAHHNNAFISNGGSEMVVRHNRLSCDPHDNAVDGGCTGDLSLFGDFEAISNVTVADNLFEATPGGYCGSFGHNPGKPFGDDPTGVVVSDNVFERGENGKCGVFGAVTSFLTAGEGNSWSNNTWADGSSVEP